MQYYSLTEEITVQRVTVTHDYVNLDMEFDEEVTTPRKRSSVRFQDEVEIAKDLMVTVEEHQTDLSDLTPKVDLIHRHWKKLHEGAHAPNPGPAFFPSKKFNDDLKIQSMLQKEIRKSLSTMEKENNEISEGLRNENRRAYIQDEKIKQIKRKTAEYDRFIEEMRKEIDTYKELFQGLNELMKGRCSRARGSISPMSGHSGTELKDLDTENNTKLEKPYENSVLLRYEIQVAKELITQVEKYENDLKPAFDLVYHHRKRLREGRVKAQTDAVPTFFPTKKFADNLKFSSTIQKELKERIHVLENTLSSLSDIMQKNKTKNQEQDENMDEMIRKMSKYDASIGEMRNEMDRYNEMIDRLSERMNVRARTATPASEEI